MTTEEKKINKQVVINNLEYFICGCNKHCQDCIGTIQKDDHIRWLEILSYYNSESYPNCTNDVINTTKPFDSYNMRVVESTYTGKNHYTGIEKYIAAKFYLAMLKTDLNTSSSMYDFCAVKKCLEDLNITIDNTITQKFSC